MKRLRPTEESQEILSEIINLPENGDRDFAAAVRGELDGSTES